MENRLRMLLRRQVFGRRAAPLVALAVRGGASRHPPCRGVVGTSSLAGAVFAAVHHAEVVAHRVGEPFGALILAIAVTVIEVALIVTLMVSRRPGDVAPSPETRSSRR